MSADSSIDGQVDWFFAWCVAPLQALARYALPASMAAYVYAMELWGRFVVQWNRTFSAIIDSFHTEVIYFYEENDNYYPYPSVLRDTYHIFLKNYDWSYDVHEKQFIHNAIDEHSVSKYRIPYLGASLTYQDPEFVELSQGANTVGDLSEWISEQTILGESNNVPLQVIVSAWAYCNHIPLIFGWKGYVLTVMNEDGDEVSYSLSEFEDESVASSSSSSTSVSSSTEEINGSIQIIGERILPQSLYDLLVPHAPVNTPLPESPPTVSSDEEESKKEK